MRYTAHVLHGFNPLEALEDEWRGLFNQAETPNPFFSAEWVFTWLNHRGGRGFPVMLIVRDADNRLVAAWSFFEYPAGAGCGWACRTSPIALSRSSSGPTTCCSGRFSRRLANCSASTGSSGFRC